MTVSASNLLILVGYGSDGQTHEFDALAQALQTQLQLPVQTAFLETAPSVGESIQAGVASYQPRYGMVLPLFIGVNDNKTKNVQMIVDAANERGFDMIAHYGKSPYRHPGMLEAYRAALADKIDAKTALLFVGRGSRDSATNAEVYQIARLLYEKIQCASVDVAFYGATTPSIAAGIQRCVQSGVGRIVILPGELFFAAPIHRQVEQQQALYPDVELIFAPPSASHPGILSAIQQRYNEALTELKAQTDSDGRYIPRPHAHGTGGTHVHRGADLLPPRYQGETPVSATPMGAADLIYDASGRVAWDEIWGDFCDLALAGGPPHRGTLLEPVAPESVRANPERYQAVLAELARGMGMVTKLPVITAASPGWIGLECADEAMALWLLRAIVVENISVRREAKVLFFPAGPDFRLEHEIKNIITVIAKTHHYWTEHITAQS